MGGEGLGRGGKGEMEDWERGYGKPRPKHHISERKSLKKIGEG